MIRVCIVARGLPVHRTGGLEYHTLDLATGLAALGNEVHVLTTSRPEGITEETLSGGVKAHYLPNTRPGDYSLSFWRSAARWLNERPFDVVHAQEFAGLFMKPRTGNFCCTVHGTMFSETMLDRRYFGRLSASGKLRTMWRFKPRLALHPFFKRMLRRADVLLVDSEYSFREALRIGPTLRPKLRLVPLGVDANRYVRNAVRDRHEQAVPTILMLGRVQEMKGIGVALDAVRILRDRGVSFRLRIGGRGDYAPVLQRRISDEHLTDVVEYSGAIAPNQLSNFFASGDLYLFPDLTQPAFGLVAVEAMLHGLPVVAARSGAIPEVVTSEVGWLYQPFDAVALSNLLERVLANPDERAKKASFVTDVALHYDASIMARATLDAYLT